jgi:hypothetical protein
VASDRRLNSPCRTSDHGLPNLGALPEAITAALGDVGGRSPSSGRSRTVDLASLQPEGASFS